MDIGRLLECDMVDGWTDEPAPRSGDATPASTQAAPPMDERALRQALLHLILQALFDRGLASLHELENDILQNRSLLSVSDARIRIREQLAQAQRLLLIEIAMPGAEPFWGLSEHGLRYLDSVDCSALTALPCFTDTHDSA